jgi:pimeloyl-ACP methyl ester carboxylesterase
MRERAIRFGSASQLLAIVTEPDAKDRRPDAPGVVLLSSGLLHRVGACRMHVRMARALADAGYVSIRFDFAGLGDSDPRRDTLPFEKSGVLETQEAMAVLADKYEVRQFVLAGLCSGADVAFYAAIEDTRVLSIVQLDPFVYRTSRYYFHRYAPRLLRLESWLNILTGKTYIGPALKKAFGKKKAEGDESHADESELVQSPYVRAFPPREEVATGLRTLIGRGVKLFHIFSGGQDEHFNYQGQYAASFKDVDFKGLLSEKHLPTATHIFTDLRHQAWLDQAMVDWTRQVDAGKPAAPRAPVPAVAGVA